MVTLTISGPFAALKDQDSALPDTLMLCQAALKVSGSLRPLNPLSETGFYLAAAQPI